MVPYTFGHLIIWAVVLVGIVALIAVIF